MLFVLVHASIQCRDRNPTRKYYMSNLKKTQLTLPADVVESFGKIEDTEERDTYIVALRAVGWTLQSIAAVTDLTRERIRQIAGSPHVQPAAYTGAWPVPTPPEVEVKAKREYIEPKPETLARLQELYVSARLVRGRTTKYRVEAEEFTKLLYDTHRPIAEGGEGVTLYRLAKRLGVTHAALRFRLARYGYKEPEGNTSKVYRRILEENRAK